MSPATLPVPHESIFHQARQELIARHADWLQTHDPDELYRNPIHAFRVERILSLTEDIEGRLLDLGCFHGYIARLVAHQGRKEVVGVDRLEPALQLARKAGIQTVNADVDEAILPFPAASFDCVLATEVLDAVFDPDAVVTEIHRVLKRGGRLIVTVPNLACIANRVLLLLGQSPQYVEIHARQGVGHLRLFTFPSLRSLLTERGFAVETMQSSVCVSPLARLSFHRVPILRRLFPARPEWQQPRIHFSTTLARIFPRWGEHIIAAARKAA